MERNEIINVLQNLAKSWFSTSQQNAIHAEIYRDKGLNKLADKFQEEATEEFEEAQKVVKRIIELGGTPKFEFVELPIYTDVKELLFTFCKDIEEGIAELDEIASKINNDFVTKNMIQGFILGEKEHFDWVKHDVKLIELIGLENYILEQL
jgi:ferritin dps family protein